MILQIITPNLKKPILLSQMTIAEFLDDGNVQVSFSDGQTLIFTGEEAKIVKAEIVFACNAYRQVQKEIHAAGESPLIVVPDHSNGQIN